MWLIYALLSAVTAAMVAIFGKIGLKNIDANTATALRAVIMAGFLVCVVLVQGHLHRIPALFGDKKALLYITLSGGAGAASWLFYFLALKYGKVAQVAPVDKLSVVLSSIIAVTLLGEKISGLNAAGIGLIAAGVILIALG